jgi:hypothetical protein
MKLSNHLFILHFLIVIFKTLQWIGDILAERVLLVLSPVCSRTRTSVDIGTHRTSSAIRRVAVAFNFLLCQSSVPVQGNSFFFNHLNWAFGNLD